MSDSKRWGAIPNEVYVALSKGEIKFSDFAVYSSLAQYANKRGECYPSQSTIATKLACSETTVRRSIKTLKTKSLLNVTTRGKNGWRNFYKLPYHPVGYK